MNLLECVFFFSVQIISHLVLRFRVYVNVNTSLNFFTFRSMFTSMAIVGDTVYTLKWYREFAANGLQVKKVITDGNSLF